MNPGPGLGSRIARTAVIGTILWAAVHAAAAGPPSGVNPEEWTNIQRQIEVERHKIFESDRPDRLYRADNPTQRFTAHFGAEDLVIEPSGRGEPAWQLGLQLTAWGAADDLQPVHAAGAIAESNRVEYRRGPLTEWYLNTTMGLEQGFTIDAPPADGIDELVLELTLDGDLTPVLSESGQSVAFRRGDTTTTLTFSGLDAWDAVGDTLEGRMELGGGGNRLRLAVAVADAAWPITVDPILTYVTKLLPTPVLDTTQAYFGQSVAIAGDLMVIGINDVELGDRSGAAHVFRRETTKADTWLHIAKIVAADGSTRDLFGYSVAISGETVIVGAHLDDDRGTDSGSAYIFQRNQGGLDAWGQVAKITAGDGADDDHFGISVAISGTTAVVGAKDDDDFGTYSGAAYIFERDQNGTNAWGQVAKITASDASEKEGFGHAVSICDDVIVVGANGLANDGHYSGAAYVFRRDLGGANAWGQVVRLETDDPTAGGRVIGSSVSISGDTAIVGAQHDNVVGWSSGSAYIFSRNQGGPDLWGQVVKIVPIDGGLQDFFGRSVSMSGDTAVVGAYAHGDYDVGAAYVYQGDHGGTGVWGQVAKLMLSNGASYDRFGMAVSISDDTVVVGAPEDNDDYADSGSVHVFRRDQGGPDAWGPTAELSCPPVLSGREDNFGTSVALSAGTLIVGATGDADNGTDSGAAYIFRRGQFSTGDWKLTTKLAASDGADGDVFGGAVSIDGDAAVVGASRDNDNGQRSGSAYLFLRNHGGPDAWGQVAKITPPDGSDFDYFGMSVSISGDTVLIGASGDDSAHVFQQDPMQPTDWQHITKISPNPSAGGFGNAVSIRGDTAVIGAYSDDGAVADSGSAYVHQRDQGGPDGWGQVVKIIASDGAANDGFGASVSLSDDRVLIGAPSDDDDGTDSGSVYVFRRDQGGPNAWGQAAKVTAADGTTYSHFGGSVGLDGDTAVVGAFESIGTYAGSAYVFSEQPPGSGNWVLVGRHPPLGTLENGVGTSVAVSGSNLSLGAEFDDSLGHFSGAVYVFAIDDPVFADGFETGDTSEWSVTVP